MKYGFTLPGRGQLATPERLGIIARKGEELGFDSLLTGDHILVPRHISSPYPYTEGGEFPGSGSGESMEQITLLSYIAGQTSKIRLVTSVLIVPHRNPLLAAKSLATLDVLSGGRLVVGVGVGWMREEFEALGLPPFEERGAVTDEYIRAFKVLWTEDDPHFEGKYISFDDISFLPKPVQKPHPPIWIGGHTNPAIRRAAKYGDGWMPIGLRPPAILEPEELAEKITRLRRLTMEAGRPEDAVSLCFSTGVTFDDSPGATRRMMSGRAEQIAADLRQYQDLGIRNFILGFPGDSVAAVDEAMEQFSKQVMPLIPQD